MSIIYEKMEFELPEETLAEVQQVYEEGFFVPHNNNPLWLSSTLHGEQWHVTGPSDAEMTWTEVAEICPETKRFFEKDFLFETYNRIRFMLLMPGGKIKAHSDANTDERYQLGQKQMCRGAINACITQPENCFLRDAKTHEEVPFTPRSIFWFNCWREHEAANNSDQLRFHMVIHGKKKLPHS